MSDLVCPSFSFPHVEIGYGGALFHWLVCPLSLPPSLIYLFSTPKLVFFPVSEFCPWFWRARPFTPPHGWRARAAAPRKLFFSNCQNVVPSSVGPLVHTSTWVDISPPPLPPSVESPGPWLPLARGSVPGLPSCRTCPTWPCSGRTVQLRVGRPRVSCRLRPSRDVDPHFPR